MSNALCYAVSMGKPRAHIGEGHGSRTPERPHEGSRFDDDLRSNAPSEQPRHESARPAVLCTEEQAWYETAVLCMEEQTWYQVFITTCAEDTRLLAQAQADTCVSADLLLRANILQCHGKAPKQVVGHCVLRCVLSGLTGACQTT